MDNKLYKIKELALNIGFIEDKGYYKSNNIYTLKYNQYIILAYYISNNTPYLQICEKYGVDDHINHFYDRDECDVRNINYKDLEKRLEIIFKHEFRKLKINKLLNG